MQSSLSTLEAGTEMVFLTDSTWVQLKRADLEPFQISLKSSAQNCEVTQTEGWFTWFPLLWEEAQVSRWKQMFYPQDRQFSVGDSKVPMKPPMRRIVSFEHQPERKSFKHLPQVKKTSARVSWCQSGKTFPAP